MASVPVAFVVLLGVGCVALAILFTIAAIVRADVRRMEDEDQRRLVDR